MSKLQKIMFIIFSFIVTFKSLVVNAAMNFWADEEVVKEGLIWDNTSVDQAGQTIINRALWFLWLLAVLYAMYWGFLILTAWDQEEKAKKWKKILFLAWLWLVVIFLAYSVVLFVTSSLLGGWEAPTAS